MRLLFDWEGQIRIRIQISGIRTQIFRIFQIRIQFTRAETSPEAIFMIYPEFFCGEGFPMSEKKRRNNNNKKRHHHHHRRHHQHHRRQERHQHHQRRGQRRRHHHHYCRHHNNCQRGRVWRVVLVLVLLLGGGVQAMNRSTTRMTKILELSVTIMMKTTMTMTRMCKPKKLSYIVISISISPMFILTKTLSNWFIISFPPPKIMSITVVPVFY